MKKHTYIIYAKDANGHDEPFEIKAYTEAEAKDIFGRKYGHKYSLESIHLAF